MLTRTLALEWASYNVCVNALGPGDYNTSMTAEAWDDPKRRKAYLDSIPLGREGGFQEPGVAGGVPGEPGFRLHDGADRSYRRRAVGRLGVRGTRAQLCFCPPARRRDWGTPQAPQRGEPPPLKPQEAGSESGGFTDDTDPVILSVVRSSYARPQILRRPDPPGFLGMTRGERARPAPPTTDDTRRR